MRRTIIVLTVVALAALIFAPPVLAAPGDLDPSFGGDGKVITNFDSSNDIARDVLIQPDGKVVVAGEMEYSRSFALARYNTDGSPDTSFDADGKLTTDGLGKAYALALQPDGKIVAAGGPGGFGVQFALARYNTDGSLDGTFDGDGKVTTVTADNPGGSTGLIGEARALAIQPDGKIVAAGYAQSGSTGDKEFALARYNTDGSLDTSFSADGKLTTDVIDSTANASDETAYALTLQSDGKMVVAGFLYTGSSNGRFVLVRYNADGSLDTSFDGDGKLTTDMTPYHDRAYELAVQQDGKIVAAGGGGIARYNASGSLDGTFSDDGKLTTDPLFEGLYDFALQLQQDGKMLVAGYASPGDFGLARYNSDGSPDGTFSGDGISATDFDTSYDSATAMALQQDGRIVAVGGSVDASGANGHRFGVARYYGGDDATAPGTSISSGPTGFVRSTSASFNFSSPEPGTDFQCSLDRAAYSSCTSPQSYSGLTNRSHTFRVRAIDSNGNADPTPASRIWTVDTVSPQGSVLINGGATTTTSRAVTLRLSANDPSPASGVAYMRFRNENTTTWSSWQAYGTSKSWTLSSGIGTKVVYVQYQDRVGNLSSAARDAIKYNP